MITKTKKGFECSISMIYFDENPLDAAKKFIADIPQSKGCVVIVKDIDSEEEFIIDTEKETFLT